jgi:hypothetical protein
MKKLQSIRWTIDSASAEFSRHASVISKNLKRLGIAPGADGKFSTKEICSAVFGDLDAERLKRAQKENRLLDMEIHQGERALIPAEFVQRTWLEIATALRQGILFNADIPETAKHEILNALPEIPKLDEYFSHTNANSNAQSDSGEDAEDSAPAAAA